MSSWSSWLTESVADATGVDVSGVLAGVTNVGDQLASAAASVSGDLQEFVDTVQVSKKQRKVSSELCFLRCCITVVADSSPLHEISMKLRRDGLHRADTAGHRLRSGSA